jgi:hypothetical protein
MSTTPYYLAARFPTEKKAGDVYFPLQQYIYDVKDDCDLSVYRFKHTDKWYVVVIGEKPSDTIHVAIEAQLTNGMLVTLEEDLVQYLLDRRREAIQFGPWVERHYDHPEEK